MDHVFEISVDRPATDVAALFTARPASWLRAFLHLATHRHAASLVGNVSAQAHWYRVWLPHRVGDDGAVSRFVWWPHLNDEVFTVFRGEIEVRRDTVGAVLLLSGVTTGGLADQNAAVLQAFVQLLGLAVSATQAELG